MNTREKILLLQKYSGLKQEELAVKIGVTFAALNRWVNGHAIPRASSFKKIDELYLAYSGQKAIPLDLLFAKKQKIISSALGYKSIIKFILDRTDVREQFELSLTFNTNRIEGSTLTENETGAILFHDRALPNKSLREQLEAKNHQTALRFLFDSCMSQKSINEEFVLKLHAILMSGIHPESGMYRRHGVRIVGTQVVTANYVKVPILMERLITTVNEKNADVVAQCAFIHAQFEKIHPFGDGNGRVGRLLMHAMLLRKNLPPALIKQGDRQKYFTYLQKAQIKEDYTLLEDFLCDAIESSFTLMG